jgi:hypothetical protein
MEAMFVGGCPGPIFFFLSVVLRGSNAVLRSAGIRKAEISVSSNVCSVCKCRNLMTKCSVVTVDRYLRVGASNAYMSSGGPSVSYGSWLCDMQTYSSRVHSIRDTRRPTSMARDVYGRLRNTCRKYHIDDIVAAAGMMRGPWKLSRYLDPSQINLDPGVVQSSSLRPPPPDMG